MKSVVDTKYNNEMGSISSLISIADAHLSLEEAFLYSDSLQLSLHLYPLPFSFSLIFFLPSFPLSDIPELFLLLSSSFVYLHAISEKMLSIIEISF